MESQRTFQTPLQSLTPICYINWKCSTKMTRFISHYDIEISKLKENIQVTLNDLSTITTPGRYDFLLKCQESFTKKNSKKLNFIKSKNFKNYSH